MCVASSCLPAPTHPSWPAALIFVSLCFSPAAWQGAIYLDNKDDDKQSRNAGYGDGGAEELGRFELAESIVLHKELAVMSSSSG